MSTVTSRKTHLIQARFSCPLKILFSRLNVIRIDKDMTAQDVKRTKGRLSAVPMILNSCFLYRRLKFSTENPSVLV